MRSLTKQRKPRRKAGSFFHPQLALASLALEYALKYQQHLKGLIISNMVSSIPAYNAYAKNVLMPAMDPKALAEILKIEAAKQYDSPRYMELLIPNFYTQHLLRLPPEQWPDPVNRAFAHLSRKLVRRLARHRSTFSGVGASDKPGAVHSLRGTFSCG